MDLNGIGTIITAVSGVLLTLGTLISTRRSTSQLNAGQMQTELELRTTQVAKLLRHVALLETTLAEHGHEAPTRPEESTAAWWAAQTGQGGESGGGGAKHGK